MANSDDLGDKLTKAGENMQNLGDRLTKGLTWPIILFFVGLFTFPWGIIAWLIGLGLFMSLFEKPKK